MSRSRVLIAILAAALCTLGAGSALAQQGSLLDAIGTLDYTRGRDVVRVGSWVKYQMKSHSELGVTDDYTVTVMIAGEEEWWGEECFWVETWTQRAGQQEETAATLISYAVFDDSLPSRHVLLYQRKRIADLDAEGNPVQQTMRRGETAMKGRTGPDPGLTLKTDTLGTETLKTPLGDLACVKVRTEQGVSSRAQSADSSQYTEIRDIRTTYRNRQVPVTGIAREELDYSIMRRTWLTGRSQESAPMRTMDRSKGVLDLVGCGTSGLEGRLIPKALRRTLAEQRAHPLPPPKPEKPKAAPPTH